MTSAAMAEESYAEHANYDAPKLLARSTPLTDHAAADKLIP